MNREEIEQQEIKNKLKEIKYNSHNLVDFGQILLLYLDKRYNFRDDKEFLNEVRRIYEDKF